MLFMLLLEQQEVDGNVGIKDLRLEALGEVSVILILYSYPWIAYYIYCWDTSSETVKFWWINSHLRSVTMNLLWCITVYFLLGCYTSLFNVLG